MRRLADRFNFRWIILVVLAAVSAAGIGFFIGMWLGG
jgi:hypothetical protein